MAIDLLADDDSGVDLLADEPAAKPSGKQTSFYDLSQDDQAKAMDLARQQISAQYPNMPDWLRDMMLSITPKDQSPRLQKAANIAKDVSNAVNVGPVAAGGLLQGFSTPLRGIASFIPGKTAKDFVNSPSMTSYVPPPQNGVEQGVQDIAELAGMGGPLGKIFGMLKGGTVLANVPKVLQNATALTGTGVIATPGDAGDKALGGAGALALGGAGKVAGAVGSGLANKVPAFLRGLTNNSTTQALVDAVQKPHDLLRNTEDQLYGYVKDAINKRNLSIPVKDEYLQQAQEVLPNTRATKKLIQNAKSGDYDAVHDLQSHLYKKGSKALTSDDIAMENQGEEILDLRNNINGDVKDNLVQSGNADIAHVLGQGRSIHKQLMDTYFNKNLPKSIGKMVHPDVRLVPDNPENIFTQDSKPMAKFLNQHPEAAKHVQGIQEKKKAIKALGAILKTTGGVGASLYAGKSLYDLL